eukprot:m.178837 g.178837  ORF g.178837 m.178837 type:complete len:431 (-) comp31953_c2_seq18:113-1405(-)
MKGKFNVSVFPLFQSTHIHGYPVLHVPGTTNMPVFSSILRLTCSNLVLMIAMLCDHGVAQQTHPWVQTSLVDMDLFVGQKDGYFCYRLPNLIQLKASGEMLAIAQAHKFNCGDGGGIDLVMRKTIDNGQTWSKMTLIYTGSNSDENVTISNPAAIFDEDTTKVHLFAVRNTKRVLLFTSINDGDTWSAPKDLTSVLVPADWNGVFTGLPQGMQLRNSRRLIVCANHVTNEGGHSHTIYSDNHGLTWQNGASVQPSHMGECSLAETSAGVFMYARVWWDDNSNRSTRAMAFSQDGGVNFSDGNTSAFPNNPGRDSQGAMITVTVKPGPNNNHIATTTANNNTNTLFLVGSPWGYSHFPRVSYTILTSAAGNGHPTVWSPLVGADPLWAGPAAYSTLSTREGANSFFTIYERGVNNSNEVLRLTQLHVPKLP